jgi:hypothetical protein
MSQMAGWLTRNKLPLAAFGVALVVFCLTAWGRLRRQSSDPHFVLQAEAWLRGKTYVETWPGGADDIAKVEEVELKDGSKVRGRRIGSKKVFRVTGGREVPIADVKATVQTVSYVSFPPLPSVLMLPQVLIHRARANDVGTTVFLAALAPAFLLVLLRRLREAGLSTRSERDELWLAGLLAFGTVFWFSSVQGRVWYTAHVVGVLLAILYAWAAIEAKRPVLAGLFLALGFVSRPPMLFMFPLFLLESWRAGRPGFVKRGLLFAAPIVVVGLAAAWYNVIRFGEPTEFGHAYLAVRQQSQIEKFGLFDLRYLTRNLAVAFTLLPELSAAKPYVQINGHGLAMWFTTPALLVLLWPREKGPLHLSLWLTVAVVAGWSLLYQNSGWVQFGYRFSLDYMVFLVLLLAVGGRPLGKITKGLIVLGVLVNLFGAVTFQRMPKFYKQDNATYNCVVQH